MSTKVTDDFTYLRHFYGPDMDEHHFLKLIPSISRGIGWSVSNTINQIKVVKDDITLSIIPDERKSLSEVEVAYISNGNIDKVERHLGMEELVKILINPDTKSENENESEIEILNNTEVISSALGFQEWYKGILEKENLTSIERTILYPNSTNQEFDREGDDYNGTIYCIVIVKSQGWTALLMESDSYGSCSHCDSFEKAVEDGKMEQYKRLCIENIYFRKICQDNDEDGIDEIHSEYRRISSAMHNKDFHDFE